MPRLSDGWWTADFVGVLWLVNWGVAVCAASVADPSQPFLRAPLFDTCEIRMVGSRRDRPRAAYFEQCESRVPLSAQPVAQTAIDPSSSPDGDPMDIAGTLRRLHDEYQLTGTGQTVVVIDSGIAYDHPALGGEIGTGRHVVGGWDFTDERDADPYDDGPAGFHGTHVAGIIGSLDPRHIGVAPGVDLVGLRVFDDQGHGDFAWIEQALQWVHQQRDQFEYPVTTVNLSIGLLPSTQLAASARVLDDEFAQLVDDGIFISVAAGNGYDSQPVSGLSYPVSSPWVVPVGSVNEGGQLSDFSRRDERMLAAPGENIQSTITDYLFDFNGVTDDWYAFSGTSQAAPFVAGAAVLVRQAMQRAGHRQIDQAAIYQVLRETADWVDDATNLYPRVDLLAAVESVLAAGALQAGSVSAGPVTTGPAPSRSPPVSDARTMEINAVDLGTIGITRLPDVNVHSTRGQHGQLRLYGSPGDDRFVSRAGYAQLQGNEYQLSGYGFEQRPGFVSQRVRLKRSPIEWTAVVAQVDVHAGLGGINDAVAPRLDAFDAMRDEPILFYRASRVGPRAFTWLITNSFARPTADDCQTPGR
jgi:hypothetical protein